MYFDVDGVFSKDFSPLNEAGEPVRTANIKDGFAIRNAIKMGFPVAVITGGYRRTCAIALRKTGSKALLRQSEEQIGFPK